MPAEPKALWLSVLARQGLAAGGHGQLESARAAAAVAVGLHAARVSSPYATAAARTGPAADLRGLVGENGDPELITVRCMRKTLHLLPVGVASDAHAATVHYRVRDAWSAARRAGVGRGEIDRASGRIVEHLHAGGRDGHRLIERAVSQRGGVSVPAARLALKVLWETGAVTYRNCAPSWHREVRRFSLREASHPGFDPTAEPHGAQHRLLAAYLAAYGPATVKDMSWWSALSRTRVVDFLSDSGAVPLRLPWAGSAFYMLPEEHDRARDCSADAAGAGRVPGGGVHFLAHEDVALKAYFESRDRYLDGLRTSAVFNAIGEARRAVIADGRIVGLWTWDHRARRVRWTALRGIASPPPLAAVRHAAAALQDRLRQGYLPAASGAGAAVMPASA